MITLSELLHGLDIEQYTGPDPLSVQVGAIRFDSRAVRPGDLFVAVRGTHADGHAYLDQALQAGAAALSPQRVREVSSPTPTQPSRCAGRRRAPAGSLEHAP